MNGAMGALLDVMRWNAVLFVLYLGGQLGVWAFSLESRWSAKCLFRFYSTLLLGALFFLVVSHGDIPLGRDPFVVQLWAKPSYLGDLSTAITQPPSTQSTISVQSFEHSLPDWSGRLAAALLCLLGILVARSMIKLVREIVHIRRLLQSVQWFRRRSGLCIGECSQISIPMAFTWGGRAIVLLPANSLNRDERRWAIRHELQHVRAGDPALNWLWAIVGTLFSYNPVLVSWLEHIRWLQELRCDEKICGTSADSREGYAQALLTSAERALTAPIKVCLMANLGEAVSPGKLKRRILMILDPKTRAKNTGLALAMAVPLLLTAVVGMATSMTLKDNRLTMEKAEQLNQSSNGEMELTVNDLVLESLNYYLATPKGKKFVKKALARMVQYQPIIDKKLAEYGIPKEIYGVPFVESGFRNLPPNTNDFHGAGLWMFIPSTAIHFGMRVDYSQTPPIDDRLDVEKETDAAMRYLLASKLKLRSWELALVEYNQGREVVHNAIEQGGTQDVWELMRAGLINRYVADFTAAALILRNPATVSEIQRY